MGLYLSKVSLNNFRSYKEFNLQFSGPLTIFYGENAAGKTNILESIQFLTALHSFRHPLSSQLIFWGADNALLNAELQSPEGRHLDLKILFSEKGRSYSLNGKVRKIIELQGLLPSVCFTPDDLNLVKGSNSIRRESLDRIGAQINKVYYQLYRDYLKILKQKNHLLKEGVSSTYRASVDEVFINLSTKLTFKRAELVDRIRPFLQEYYHIISQGSEKVEVLYIPSWLEKTNSTNYATFDIVDSNFETIRSLLNSVITHNSLQEQRRGHALFGAHADRVAFLINNHDASSFASQGQQRSLVLAYKLAEVSFIQQVCKQKPLLLLDDVMSELDESRRDALLEFIQDDIQTFITTTNLGYFSTPFQQGAQIVYLHKDNGVSHAQEAV